ncbi:MAG TPA: peptidylprolyl isomerase, partial [Thermoanaerobaculia bacterium]|nr:peptidylprolyl isomerase [Thermoanaerobaculia bacterium]
LRKRYDASHEDYRTKEAAHILHILIKVDPNAPPPVDAAAKAKAEDLVKQLRAGADFAKLAKENSGDPSSSGNGGDMGFIERGLTVEPFENAAFSVPLNAISDPIRTKEYGYHIIKVLARRPEGYRPFEEVRPQLVAQVTDQLAKDHARDEITRISMALKEKKPKSPEQFTAMANDKVSSNDTLWFQKNDTIPGLGNNQVLSTWVFSGKEGDIGDIIGTQRGPAIPYLYGIRPAGISPLEDVKAKVEGDARMARARELARETLAKAMTEPTIDAIAAKVGLTASEASVTRNGSVAGLQGDISPVVDAAMSAQVGQTKGPIVVGDAAVAFQVLDLKKIDAADLAKNSAQYMEMLRQQEARSLRAALLRRLRKQSNVDFNTTLLTSKSSGSPSGV